MRFLMHLDNDVQQDLDFETEQVEAEEPNGRVLIHNDDVTPMDFVVVVLTRIFELSVPEAEVIMLTAHLKGIAFVVTLPLPEAKKRVGKAHFAAGLEGYPLHFTIETE